MKTSRKLAFLAVILSLFLSTLACGNGEMLYDNQERAGNPDPTSQPEAYATAAAQGPVASEANIFDNLVTRAESCDPLDEIAAEINGEAFNVIVCQQFSGQVDVLDAAFVGTIAFTPGFAADDAVVGVVWAGSKVVKIILIAGSIYATGQTILNMAHSDWQHDPNIEGSQARANITALLATWTTLAANGAPDPNKVRCGIIKSAEGVLRAVVFLVDSTGQSGTLSWWNVKTNEWGGSYDVTLQKFTQGMSQETLQKNRWTWKVFGNCSDPRFPGGGNLPPLQPAR